MQSVIAHLTHLKGARRRGYTDLLTMSAKPPASPVSFLPPRTVVLIISPHGYPSEWVERGSCRTQQECVTALGCLQLIADDCLACS